MKISILPLLATTSLAFNVVPEPRTTTHLSLKNEDVALPFPFVDGPFEDIDPDMDRAKDCADHIGKCSLKEIAKLKEEVHNSRIKNMIFGGPTAPEAAFETRLVEEELALQLDLLREETPKPYLFPKIEEPMIELPHLKDGDTAAALKVQKGTQNAVLEEMVEEGVFDSLAICALLGAVMFVPQLLH